MERRNKNSERERDKTRKLNRSEPAAMGGIFFRGIHFKCISGKRGEFMRSGARFPSTVQYFRLHSVKK